MPRSRGKNIHVEKPILTEDKSGTYSPYDHKPGRTSICRAVPVFTFTGGVIW